MKTLLKFVLICLFLNVSQLFADDYVTLSDCIKDKTVECKIKVNPNGTHYTIQFIINVKNLKTKSQNIVVEPGLLFIADDDPNQNFIVTKQERFVLEASANKDIQIHAMCIEHYDSAPQEASTYKIGKMAEGKLLELAQLLNTNQWFDKSEAQIAVWCIANNNDISNIIGADDSVVKKLQEFVATATKQQVPKPEVLTEQQVSKPEVLTEQQVSKPEVLTDYEHNYYSTEYTRKVMGSFEYTLSHSSIITIGMFDKNNILVRELYNNQAETTGYHKFDFAFDATVYTDPSYFFKLIQNGEVQIDMEFKSSKN